MSNTETTIDPAAQTLSHVQVGQKVWYIFKHRGWGERPAEVNLATITHIDKSGRLYICSETSDKIGNWRYGFDPATGLSNHGNYDGTQLAYASPEGIAAWTAAKEATIDVLEAQRRSERQEAIYGKHGRLSYGALLAVVAGDVKDVVAILASIETDLSEEAADWADQREEYRNRVGSSVSLTWADLPEFRPEAVSL